MPTTKTMSRKRADGEWPMVGLKVRSLISFPSLPIDKQYSKACPNRYGCIPLSCPATTSSARYQPSAVRYKLLKAW